jgi:hypothetical protein
MLYTVEKYSRVGRTIGLAVLGTVIADHAHADPLAVRGGRRRHHHLDRTDCLADS